MLKKRLLKHMDMLKNRKSQIQINLGKSKLINFIHSLTFSNKQWVKPKRKENKKIG